MILALLLVAAPHPPFQPTLPRGCKDRSCVRQRVVGAGGADFTPSATYAYAATGSIPTCTGDATCVASCFVSSGTTWVCKDSSGVDTGSVAQGTSPTAEGTFAAQMRARSNVSDTTAPTASGTALSNLVAGDMTVICGGIWHPNGATPNSAYVSIGDATNLQNLFSMFTGSGNFNCSWGESGVFPSATVAAPLQGWAVVSCRRSGNNRIARVNGTDGTTVSTVGTRGIDAGLTVGFGRERPGATGRNLAGPLAFCNFYSESKTSAWLRAAENSFWGVGLDAGTGSSGLLGLVDDAGTNVDFFAAGAHVVSPDRGLRTVGQAADNIQAKWAADPFDVSSWTSVGTPLIGAIHSSADPFMRWKQDGGCWNLEDDSAAAFEGKESAELQRSTAAGAAHGWNFRVWASKGDAGTTRDKMRISALSADGLFVDAGPTGTQIDCDFTLDDTIRPYDCQFSIADAGVTTVKGRVVIGTTAATTGSIAVCNAQDTAHPFPQLSLADNTAFGFSLDQIDPSQWPSTAGKGKYEVVWSALWNMSSQWDNSAGTIYLFDATNSTPVHAVVLIGGYTASSNMMGRITDASGNMTEFQVGGISTAPGQRYATSMEWRPIGGGRCDVTLRHNSCSGSAASCTATSAIGHASNGYCPAQPTAVKLGNRYDNSVPTSVFIDAVRVSQ